MNYWKNRTAFITGATGFVGAHITRHLIEAGAQVVCLQRDATRSNPLDLFGLRPNLTTVNGALEDYPLLERVLNEYEIEAVFHLAAQAIVGTANRSPLSTFEANIRGTYNLLEAARRTPTVKRIVVASSDKAYGSHTELPYKEGYQLNGLFPYDVSKVCTDVIARSYAHTFGTPVAVTRFANIYGPGDMNLSRIIPGTILSVLRDERPIIRSDGTPVREFVHVDDVARGYLMLAEKIEQHSGEAFNFGAAEPVQMLDLVNRIIKLAGKKMTPDILLDHKIDREIDAQYLSADKASELLGWRAQIGLDEGLRQTIPWYQQFI